MKSVIYNFIKRDNQIFKLNLVKIQSKLWSQDEFFKIKEKTPKITVRLTSDKFEIKFGKTDTLMKSIIYDFIKRNNQIFKLHLKEDVHSKLWAQD